MGWWLGLAPATLEFWVRFPNERNQGKQAHPVLKYRVPHGSCSNKHTHIGSHTGLGSSSLVAHTHVLPYPPPPHANSFVLGPAVINTHTIVRDGQPSPHRPRLVVSRSTCPPISPPPTRKQLCTRSCSNKHTHTPISPPPQRDVLELCKLNLACAQRCPGRGCEHTCLEINQFTRKDNWLFAS
jgi:hypothetical protein